MENKETVPKPQVTLTGVNGNAFAIMAECKRAGRKGGMSRETIDEFLAECMSGDYDNLLMTCHKWFDVD